MAAIRETLILEDKFTSTMTQCLQVAQRMANMLDDVRASTMNVEAAAAATAVQMQELAGKMTQTNSRGTSLLGTIRNLAGTFLGMQSVRWLVNTSDQLTSINARLRLMTGSAEAAAAAQEEIYQAAMRSRGAYADMADFVSQLGTVAGNAFTGTDELVAFAEQIQKQMAISGASGASAQAALVQLTQGLASGTLRGEELNSVLEQTPMIAQTIAEYMGVTTGEMRELASEGKVTAEVVKNAMLGAAEETNAQFEQMPMTWAQVWTMMSNIALQALEPVLTFINWLANNIEIIGPLVLGVAAALAVYLIATKGVAAATKVWTAVQTAFNAVMALNPVFLIIMGIILLIALIYAVVAAVNRVTGASTSATGIICGAVLVLAAIIGNTVIGLLNAIIQFIWSIFVEPFLGIIEWILNVCNGGFNSFGDAVANLIGNIISWFLSLGKVVTKIIDAIFGTDWTGGLNALQDKVLAWGKNENSITLDREAPTIDHRFEYGDAWSKGYDFGAGVEDKIGGMFNMGDGSGFDMSSMMGDVGSIAGDTGSIADSLSVTDEELEYLRDIAERDAINRFTTAEVKIDMTGMTNKIDGSADIDGIITELTDGFTEALVTAAEGVHA